jgi:hypothetical protein
MQLVASLPDIMPEEADERIRPVYEDLKQVLRVPFVNLIFRTLVNYPDYLVPAWERLRPVLRTRAFEQAADELRAGALPEPAPDAPGMDWKSIGELDRIRAFNDTTHYVLPKLLLVAVALDQASFGPAPAAAEPPTEDNSTQEIPLGVAEGTTKAQMVAPEEARGRVRELFQQIKGRHNHSLVPSYYRVLGNWPDFLEAAWSRIEPLAGSTVFEDRKRDLIDRSQEAVHALPVAGMDELELDEAQSTEIRSVLAAFRLKFIPEMLIDVAMIEALLDGPEAARSSRFSAAERGA